MSGFPAWGSDRGTRNPSWIWPWSPKEFDYRTSTGLGETETPVMEGTNKTLGVPRPRGKEQWPHRSMSAGPSNYLLVLEGLLWVSRGPPQGWGHWQQQSWKVPLVWALLKFAIDPTLEPIDPKTWSPRAKLLTGKGHNPTYQQIFGFKALLSRALSIRARPLGRNGVAIIVNKRIWNAVLGCNLKNDRMIPVYFQDKPFNITVIQVYALTSNAEEA